MFEDAIEVIEIVSQFGGFEKEDITIDNSDMGAFEGTKEEFIEGTHGDFDGAPNCAAFLTNHLT